MRMNRFLKQGPNVLFPQFFARSLAFIAVSSSVLANDNTDLETLKRDLASLQDQLASSQQSSWADTITIGGLIQGDTRLFEGGQNDIDNLLIRRARIDIRGVVSDSVSFRILPEFSDGNDNGHLLDAYVDIRHNANISWRIGKFKSPVGIERVQSVPRLSFIERGLTDNLVPNRDVGIALTYQASAFAGTVGVANNAGDRQDTDIDNDNGKALFWRLFWQTPLNGLGVGTSGSVGHTDNNSSLPTYKSSGRSTIFSYADNVVRDGDEHRLAAHAMWYRGQFGSFAEYVVSETSLLNDAGTRLTAQNTGWQMVASWMLTGEQNAWSDITPSDGSGAWELLLRVSELTIDQDVFTHFASPANAVAGANSVAVGLSWYVSPHIKVLTNYEHTSFSSFTGGDVRSSEKLLSARLQLFY